MKYPLLRLALAGGCLSAVSMAPMLAHAKSAATTESVQLYGVVDVSLQYLNNANHHGRSAMGLSSGDLSGSRWGLRGSESLGNGLSTVFLLEGGMDVGTGTKAHGSRLFGREAYVGLSSKDWGTLTGGRHDTFMNDWMSKYNAFGNATFSGKRMDDAFSDRADQSLKYVGRFGNVSVGTMYSFGWNNDQHPADKRRGRLMSVGVRYAASGLDTAVLYYRKHADKPGSHANSDNREDRVVLGASYQMGSVTVSGGHRWLRQHLTTESYTSNMTWVGATYSPTQPLRLLASVYYLAGTVCDDMNLATCPVVQGVGKSQKPVMLVLGSEYDFSKRTTVYALAGYVVNRKDSSLSLDGGKYGATVEPGRNQFGLSLGMRHRF
jgi:predicted porin